MSSIGAAKQRAYKANARARGAEDPSLIPHGTSSGYQYWGCRCEECTAANTEHGAEWREFQRRKAAGAAGL